MTNKEAAEILKLYKQRLDESCSNLLDRDKEAFDLAIKALEGDIQTAVWELYQRYQPRLATNVYEFGIELRELLGRYGVQEND